MKDYKEVHGGSRRRRQNMVEQRQEVGVPGLTSVKTLASKIPQLGSKAAGALGAGAGAIGGALLSPFRDSSNQQNGGNGQNGGGSGSTPTQQGIGTTEAAILAGSALGAGALIYKMTDDPQQPTRFGPGPSPQDSRNQRRMQMSRNANSGTTTRSR